MVAADVLERRRPPKFPRQDRATRQPAEVSAKLETRCSAGHVNNSGASWCSECGEACSTIARPSEPIK